EILLDDFYPYNTGAYISSYKDGSAVFSVTEDGKIKYIYIDKNGKKYFDDCFDDAYPFSEDLAVAEKNGKRGVIDKTGEFVYCNDGVSGEYAEGYVEFCIETADSQKYGFLDRSGNIAISAKYDYIYKDFLNGAALVREGEKLTYIDHDGNEIYSFDKPEDKNMGWALY
ncbi:MAG: WG repeat-containing protein, partial [Oscillospiraceae bacterium]|nr:WG repeat-containing protein [Oscillospiraceae bacterium]